MPERKKTEIISLNTKKLITQHLVWNTIRKLQWGIFHYMINPSANSKRKFTQIW